MTPLIGRTTLNPPLPHPTHIHGPPIDSGEISSRRDDWMLSHERQAWARAIEEARGGRGWGGGKWEDEEEEKEKRGSCVHFYPKKGKTERKRKKRRKIILRKIITPRQKIRPKRGGAGEGRIEKEEEKEEGE